MSSFSREWARKCCVLQHFVVFCCIFAVCLLCSGGIAQYELNEFMLQASEAPVNISLADVDSWCASINYPRGVKRLSTTFFTKRVQMEHNCHLRCFASECLLAIDVTNLFFEQKMEPAGLMLEHGKCLRMLKSISDILGKPLSFPFARNFEISDSHCTAAAKSRPILERDSCRGLRCWDPLPVHRSVVIGHWRH